MTVWIRAADAPGWHRMSELEYEVGIEAGRFILACGGQLRVEDGWQEAADLFVAGQELHGPCSARAEREAVWVARIGAGEPLAAATALVAEHAPQLERPVLVPGETPGGLCRLELRAENLARPLVGVGRSPVVAAAELLAALEARAAPA